MPKKPRASGIDLRTYAAERWKERHGLKTVHDAYRDTQFRETFNRYLRNPSERNRKLLGLATGTEREKRESHLIRSLKQFGDTP